MPPNRPRYSLVQRTFSNRARLFERTRENFWRKSGEDNRIKQLARTALRALDDRGYPVWLDFGAGSGRLVERLIPVIKSGAYIALLDCSFEMLQRAEVRLSRIKAAGKVNLRLVCTTASHTPFESDFFDLTTAKMLLHHVHNPCEVLSEMVRVTKPGGTLLVQVPGPLYQSKFRVGQGPWMATHFQSEVGNGNEDPLGRCSEQWLERIALRIPRLELDTIYSDHGVYGFRDLGAYLAFMDAVGADAKLRDYRDDKVGSWRPYAVAGVLSAGGEMSLHVNFVCVKAHKNFRVRA